MNISSPLPSDFTEANNPFSLFEAWLHEAEESENSDANAMTLATVDSHGQPNARIVLLKGFDEQGFVFYTNMASRKAEELREVPKAALCFHWKSLGRQVRIRGSISMVSDAEADAYFATRPRESQVGAWASRQSTTLASREALEQKVAYMRARFEGASIPRPPYWSGFRLGPEAMEFWQNGSFRLHDRILFTRNAEGEWGKTRLSP